VTYGIQCDKQTRSYDLGGWSTNEGSRFHFTIHFPSIKFREHDKLNNGKITRDLMNQIQKNVNSFYSNYVNK